MKQHELKRTRTKKTKRVGRGYSSGLGHTSGRGTKGQKARTGHNIPTGFEGGQTKLTQRLPKRRGFSNFVFKKDWAIFNLSDLELLFNDGETVSPKSLVEKGITKKEPKLVKILGKGTLTKKLKFKGVSMSKSVAALYPMEQVETVKVKKTKKVAGTEDKIEG